MQLDGASLALWRDPRKRRGRAAPLLPQGRGRATSSCSRSSTPRSRSGCRRCRPTRCAPRRKALLKTLGKAARHAGKLGEIVALGDRCSQAETVEECFESDIIRAALMIGLPFMNYHADGVGLGADLPRHPVQVRRRDVPRRHRRVPEGAGASACATTAARSARAPRSSELIVRGGRVVGVRLAERRGALRPPRRADRVLAQADADQAAARGRAAAARCRTAPSTSRPAARGFADYKLNVALKGRIRMTKHEKWRGDGLDLRLGANCFHTYEETLDAQAACDPRRGARARARAWPGHDGLRPVDGARRPRHVVVLDRA